MKVNSAEVAILPSWRQLRSGNLPGGSDHGIPQGHTGTDRIIPGNSQTAGISRTGHRGMFMILAIWLASRSAADRDIRPFVDRHRSLHILAREGKRASRNSQCCRQLRGEIEIPAWVSRKLCAA